MRIQIDTSMLVFLIVGGIALVGIPLAVHGPLAIRAIVMVCGLALLACIAWFARTTALDIDDEWIRPLDSRHLPMRWNDIVDVESHGTHGAVLTNRAGHRLPFSPSLQLGEFF